MDPIGVEKKEENNTLSSVYRVFCLVLCLCALVCAIVVILLYTTLNTLHSDYGYMRGASLLSLEIRERGERIKDLSMSPAYKKELRKCLTATTITAMDKNDKKDRKMQLTNGISIPMLIIFRVGTSLTKRVGSHILKWKLWQYYLKSSEIQTQIFNAIL